MRTISNVSPESPDTTLPTQKPLNSLSKVSREAWSKTFSGPPFRIPTKPLRRRRFRALSRAKWSKTFLALDGTNHEETNATINEDGSRTHPTNRIAVTAGIRTEIGDKMQGHPNTILPRPHHPTRTSQSPWISTVPGPPREEDVR